jgi:polar amino acid transport system permease protein
MEFTDFLDQAWASRNLILVGLGRTILISGIAIGGGTILGVVVGILLTYGNIAIRFIVRIYTDFLRGTPVFVLILACFYILSVAGVDLTAFQAGTFALTLFCSSHVGEIVRGALKAIPVGQTEAARSIGLTFPQIFTNVLMPQAMRQILPTWVNPATEIVKASTLLSIIGVIELLLTIQQIISRTFMTLEFYFLAGVLYFVVDFAIERAGRYFERRVAIPK